MPKNPDGPFVSFATFCERVLEEKDGVLSLIRVVDRVAVQVRGAEVPDQLPAGMVNLTLCIGFKKGAARGRRPLTLEMEDPTGATHPLLFEVDVLFEGEPDRGTNSIFQMSFPVQMEGLHWVHVFLQKPETKITQVPLRVVYQRLSTGGS